MVEDAPVAPITKEYKLRCTAVLFTWQTEVPFERIQELEKFKFVKTYSIVHEEAARRHTHAYLEFFSKVDHSLGCWKSEFVPMPDDAQPNKATGSGYRIAVDRGHFYCQCPWKNSYVAHITNYHAGSNFSVRIQWIQSLWDQSKMDRPEDCAAHYNCLTPNFASVVRLSQNRKRAMQMQKELDDREEKLRKTYTPYKDYEEVFRWMHQMQELKGSYEFLWIWGPPKMAKSPFAAQLYPNPCIFEGLPNWTNYDPVRHNCIIFDDMPNVEGYILDHKRIFQSASRNCNVNCTAGMTCALQIMTVQKPIIIISNSAPFSSWIIDRCFQLHVKSKMYE